MFEEKFTSLGALNDSEKGWVFSFLRGSTWKELFESLDNPKIPPDWLIKWSKSWRHDRVFYIDDLDPLYAEYWLIIDRSAKEVWSAFTQGDDAVVFIQLASTEGKPDVDRVCSFFLAELEGIGSAPLCGNFKIYAPKWLPKKRMTTFLKKRMNELGFDKLHDLPLEQWLDQNYTRDAS